MTTCRWNTETRTYLDPDGQPCKVDAYGDPTRHCGVHRCAWHVGTDELHCARCIAGVRRDLQWIGPLTALMPAQAIADGVHSEAIHLAGPAADAAAWSWRKVHAKRGGPWHASLEEDDDERHPRRVLGIWARMITEDYGHPMPARAPLAWCAAYLGRQLHRIAHDPEQDFGLLRAELRKCRAHLEVVLHNDARPDRGAPCPECVASADTAPPRLERVYAHWCEDEDCERVHVADAAHDEWRCPRDHDHAWTHEAYENYVQERKRA